MAIVMFRVRSSVKLSQRPLGWQILEADAAMALESSRFNLTAAVRTLGYQPRRQALSTGCRLLGSLLDNVSYAFTER